MPGPPALTLVGSEQVEYQVRDRLSFSRFLGSRSRTAFRIPRRSVPREAGQGRAPRSCRLLRPASLARAVEQLLDQPGLGELLANSQSVVDPDRCPRSRAPEARDDSRRAPDIPPARPTDCRRFQNQHPEHQEGIERLPAGAALLQLSDVTPPPRPRRESFPRHETIDGFERIALR